VRSGSRPRADAGAAPELSSPADTRSCPRTARASQIDREGATDALSLRASTLAPAGTIEEDGALVYRGSKLTACLLGTAALTAAVAAVAVDAVAAARGAPHSLTAITDGPFLVAVGAPACVGVFLLLRRPKTRVAWILVIGPLSVAAVMAAGSVADLALWQDRSSILGRWALLLSQEWVALFLWPLALAYSFPDGRLPSRRWRPLAWLALASGGGAVILLLLQTTIDTPVGRVRSPLPFVLDQRPLTTVFWICWGGLLASLFGGALALLARYRTGSREQRRQVLWLAYGVLLLPLWLGGTSLWSLAFGSADDVDFPVLLLLQAWPAVAVAVAVTRHGLYAIDRVLNRTAVYASLTALLAGTYALVALLAGRLGSDSPLAASLATLASLLAFRPLRDRLQQLVDRRFARARWEGIEQMRSFLEAVRDAQREPEEVGGALAQALQDSGAEVLFALPETERYADRFGNLVEPPRHDGRCVTPIRRGERLLGLLLHDPRLTGEPDLLHGVLDAAAVPVELGRLRVQLRLMLVEVERSRTRIAEAGYAERRRLERDLHDGAQQRLVTLGIVLRRLQRSLPAEARILAPAFDTAVDEVSATISDLRTIAAGVRPPRLDEGLAAALGDLARAAPVTVRVEATSNRAPPEIEAAAYFIVCEAVTNAIKHASSSQVTVRTVRTDAVLRLVVADDGVGGAAPGAGSGLRGLADRVDAQRGTLALESPPGGGTRIAVELPCAS
jgi:signal transduction histidine kinase